MRTLIILCALALGGCATMNNATNSIDPVCTALTGPITYNSRNTASPYHAGKKLAPQLAQQNQVGADLHCKGYE